MNSTTFLHGVKTASVDAEWQGQNVVTTLRVRDDNGSYFELHLFSDRPLAFKTPDVPAPDTRGSA